MFLEAFSQVRKQNKKEQKKNKEYTNILYKWKTEEKKSAHNHTTPTSPIPTRLIEFYPGPGVFRGSGIPVSRVSSLQR